MFSPYDYYVTPDEYEEAMRQGIPRVRVDERIRKLGWGKREAITKPLRGYKDRSEIMKLAKAHGISYNQFIGRVLIGWDERLAATVPLRDISWQRTNIAKAREFWRKHPRDMVELAAKNGIKNNTFRYRVRKGWDYIRAATTPPSPSNAAMRLKELYGEEYHRKFFKQMRDWIFAPGRIKRGEKKKSP